MKRRVIGGNVVDENTLLLLHFDGAFRDSSIYNRTIYESGNPTLSSDGVFNKSIYIDQGSYLYTEPLWFKELTNSPQFTIDFRFKLSGYINVGIDDGSTNGMFFRITTGGVIEAGNHYKFTNYGISENVTIPSGWNHIAFVCHSGMIKIYLNGLLVISRAKYAYTFPSGNFYIGSRSNRNDDFGGYIDEFRISDIARWTSNFTPPTKPY